MSAPGIHLGRRSDAQLDAMLERALRDQLSYDHVGSTLDPASVGTGRMRERVRTLGRGRRCFDTAVAALRGWACHTGPTTVHPRSAPVEEGTTVLVVLRVSPASIVVANRIVAVVDEPARFGFAYGTLKGHQERGEEAFLVELLGDDSVRATVRVDAAPATPAAHLAAPALPALQLLAATHYLRSLAAAVEANG
jgi:uncharacterized protein (UPF0548 family)